MKLKPTQTPLIAERHNEGAIMLFVFMIYDTLNGDVEENFM